MRAPREILETTRAECRIEKITLTQSHRRVAGKVLYILYLKASVGQAETTHTRACVRACVLTRFIRASLSLLCDRSHLNLPSMRVVVSFLLVRTRVMRACISACARICVRETGNI